MTPKENCNENLRKSISGIFGKKFMGTHCNALLHSPRVLGNEEIVGKNGELNPIFPTFFQGNFLNKKKIFGKIVI